MILFSYFLHVCNWLFGLSEIKLTTPKNNLNPAERDALKALKRDIKISLKKADKGTTTVGSEPT